MKKYPLLNQLGRGEVVFCAGGYARDWSDVYIQTGAFSKSLRAGEGFAIFRRCLDYAFV